ncbi:MAG: hypothetical protein HOV71_16110 [Hamadaea sp.]|uniref:hypothetical protein n=1 Tax=Hamadaea sp. NPDC050747 TaxID=3155789 RepID=UPI0018276448|nr:hypothetical protein [Hamadaea sp.]NUR49654.1 hypothetical protein [Hamadaea sp.]
MMRIVDRLISKVVRTTTASACSGADVCLGGITFWRYCCPDSGCSYTFVHYGC